MTGRSSRRRGKCRYCGRRYALTLAGKIRRHNIAGKAAFCGGSGQVPA